MGLRFGCPGAYGGPRNEIRDVLRSDRVEEFCSGGDPQVDDVAKEVPGYPQTLADIFGPVEIRIHDKALPAKRGAWFLEIDPHDEANTVIYPFFEIGEAPTVLEAGIRIVNRARSDDDEEPMIIAKDDTVNFLSGLGNEIRLVVRFGDLF